MSIWSCRVKRGIKGVQTVYIEASTYAMADKVGRVWCASQPGYGWIANSVEPMVIADESILVGVPVRADVESDAGVGHKPDAGEQARLLARQSAQRAAGTGVGSVPKTEPGRVGA